MKLKAFAAIAAAGLLALTACTAEEPILGGAGGNVTFRVATPGSLSTRADESLKDFGNGKTATKLAYHLYEVSGTGEEKTLSYITSGSQPIDIETNVRMNLVTGKTYGIVWLAQADPEPYDYDPETHLLTVDYATLAQNLENRDAFYEYTEVKVDGAIQEDVKLLRPFAQVNFGTSDMSPAAGSLDLKVLEKAFGGAGLPGLETQLAITTDLPTTLDLVSKKTSGKQTVTFEPTACPKGYSFPYQPKGEETGYEYLAMDYLLVPGEGAVADLDFSVLNSGEEYNRIKISAVPLKQNYRTNVFGQLLTSSVDFDVEVKPMFDQDYNPDENLEIVREGVYYDATTDTYTLSNEEGLIWFRDISNGATRGEDITASNFKLGCDVDLKGAVWTPICDASRKGTEGAFTGTFDGQSHTVSNFTVDNKRDNYSAGLIGLANNATIRNVKIANAEIRSVDAAGAVVGTMLGATTVSGCQAAADVKVSGIGAGGGIVGRAYGTANVITDCVNHANLYCEIGNTGGSASKLGGIVGIASCEEATLLIDNCVNYGNVDLTMSGCAGIVGYVGKLKAEITNCTNNGKIGYNYLITSQNPGAGIVANVIGTAVIDIRNCHNNGYVCAGASGGIQATVGQYQTVNIYDCTNTARIDGTFKSGGIVGISGDGTIENCVNTGIVHSFNGQAGGVAGECRRSDIINCSGGKEKIFGKGPLGRLIGAACSGAGYPSVLRILDDNGDDYSDGLCTVGTVSLDTALAEVVVESGTFHGNPMMGNNTTSYICIKEGASWDLFPGQTGYWYYRDGAWTLTKGL